MENLAIICGYLSNQKQTINDQSFFSSCKYLIIGVTAFSFQHLPE